MNADAALKVSGRPRDVHVKEGPISATVYDWFSYVRVGAAACVYIALFAVFFLLVLGLLVSPQP